LIEINAVNHYATLPADVSISKSRQTIGISTVLSLFSVCCVQGSASECVLVSMLAARHAALDDLKLQYPGVEDGILLARMVAYCSKLVTERK